jgi:hypothetical protein
MSLSLDDAASAWTRGVAIRPVPSYAIVAVEALSRIEEELADDDGSGPN